VQRVEIGAVQLELRRIGRLVAGRRQPLVEHGVDRLVDHRHMALVAEHRIVPRRQPEVAEVRRQIAGTGHLDPGDVLETAVVAGVAAHPVGGVADLAGHPPHVWVEGLPQAWDAFVALEGEAPAEASDDEGIAVFETRFGKRDEVEGFHAQWLQQGRGVVGLAAQLARRHAEQLAEGPGERFVRAVASRQRYFKDVRAAAAQGLRGTAQAPGPHIAHHRPAGGGGELACQGERRKPEVPGDTAQVQVGVQGRLDVPQDMFDASHSLAPQSAQPHYQGCWRTT
jgi:hypothetical protein